MNTGWRAMPARKMAAAAVAFCAVTAAQGAAFFVETFDGSSGWYEAGAGMAVVEGGLFGNPAGSLAGTFAAQGTPSPETDAFRGDGSSSGSAFTGDYFADVPTFTSWIFDFYADDVLPSDLIIRFGDGVSTFIRSVLTQVGSIDTWTQVTVPLSYAGWLGGSPTAFNNALANVTFIDVQITRNGTGAQHYYLDNFELSGNQGGGGGGADSIPEPSEGLVILGALLLFAVRRTQGTLLLRTRDLRS